MATAGCRTRGIQKAPEKEHNNDIGLRFMQSAFDAFSRSCLVNKTNEEILTSSETFCAALAAGARVSPLSHFRQLHHVYCNSLLTVWGPSIHRLLANLAACPHDEPIPFDLMRLILRTERIFLYFFSFGHDAPVRDATLVFFTKCVLQWILICDRALTTNRLEIPSKMLGMKNEAISLFTALSQTIAGKEHAVESHPVTILTCFAADLFAHTQICHDRLASDAIPTWYRAVHRCWPHTSVAAAMLQISIFTIGAERTESIGVEAQLATAAQGAKSSAKDCDACLVWQIDDVKSAVSQWITFHRNTAAVKDPDPEGFDT